MRKKAIWILAATIVVVLAGCGQKEENQSSAYAEALDVWETVMDAYEAEELFAVYGGDQEHAVMDAPGKFDIQKTEELEATLGLPQSQWENIDDAASMVHMMNGNLFTGAVYRLKEGTDGNVFAQEVKANILETQWLCGQPDTLLILKVDGSYVLTAYGDAEIMETFQEKALSSLKDAKVLIEAPIV